MSTTIEQLELEVQSSATSAVSGIDALASSLGKLKSAVKGGVGLTAVAKQLTTLNTALNGVSGANADNLNKLAQGLQTLSSIGNLKLSSSVATQITNIGSAARSLDNTNFTAVRELANVLTPLSQIGNANLNSFISQLQRLPQAVQALNSVNVGSLSTNIRELVSALTPLTQMGRNNLTSFITQLKKLPEAVAALQSVNIGSLASQIQQLANAFAPLATQMQSIANGFSALPTRLQRLIQQTNNLSAANGKASMSYVNLAAKIGIAVVAMKRILSVIAGWITKSNEYVESLNLFTVSLGEYAAEAQKYAENVAEVMGIDPAEWLRNQGVFMTLATGFGVVNDRAYTMSKNLTQLGYDLSSFFNISYEDAFQKLQSGISGELEPLRRLGYDLSVARLQQEALNLGITKSVNAMTQAEKAELRYYAIMTQVTTAQGDMARTLEAPANQLRILKAQVNQAARALGNIFIPMLNAVLPYAIALAKAIRLVADAIARLFGFTLPEIDYSGLSTAAGGAGDLADNLGDAGKKAKEVKNALLGIDELNIISPKDDSISGSGSGIGGGGGGLGFELPTYDFIGNAMNDKIEEILGKMKEWLGLTEEINSWSDLFNTRLGKILLTVSAIGAGLAAWKIARSVAKFVKTITSFKGFGAGWAGLGALGLLSDLNEFIGYFKDFLKNKATFQNVVGMISEFTGAIGDCFSILGSVRVGGALKVVQAIGEIAVAIKDISESGVNWENANTAIRGLTNIAIGIGMLTRNLKVAEWGLAIQGFTSVIMEISENWDAIKQGDWRGVDMVTLIIGGLEAIGGLVSALDVFSNLKGLANIGKASEAASTVATATETLNTTVSTKLSPNLTSLAKNLGMGIVIIGEVAIAAGLIAGAVWGLGVLLEKVGESWKPVIDNGGTVAAAMGIGIGILAAVGIVTALLGSAGKLIIKDMALGAAILIELGIATGLFIVEIWAIGKGLDEIRKAWQPVLDNGLTIAIDIGIGTLLLIGIGVVTAALGAATVASVGALPLAIGLGTTLLVALAAAFVLFCESLVAVANELVNNLAPTLEDINDELPTLSDNMGEFVDFMTDFASEVVRYTEVSTIADLSATIDTIVGWFTQDPIDKLAGDVKKIYDQTATLNEKLNLAVPELRTATNLLKRYKNFVTEIETLCDSNVELSTGMFVNMEEVGQKLVTGFADGIKSKSSDFSNAAKTLVDGFNNSLNTNIMTCKPIFIFWASGLKNWFTSMLFGAINRTTFGNYARNIVSGFNNGITNNYAKAKSGMTSFANTVKNAFTGNVSRKVFYGIAKDVISGFNNGINDFYDTTRPYMRRWANDTEATYKSALDSHSPSKRFMRIGEDTVLGYNLGISNLGGTTKGVVTEWVNSFASVNPTMSFAVDTSALRYYDSNSFAKTMSANVVSTASVTATGFKEGMEEFYREYVEPTMAQMAADMRRQADKPEQTVVQIGNRVVNDAVTTQKRANGYAFAK